MPEVIGDPDWLEAEFIAIVQKRGAAVIEARGSSSAASAAHAAIDSVNSVWQKTPKGDWHSLAVCSTGEYGAPEGLQFGFPVVSDGKSTERGRRHRARRLRPVPHQGHDRRAALRAGRGALAGAHPGVSPAPEDAAAVRRDVDRLVAFSDGVFAIAITLLVLSITVPNVSDKHLGKALRDLGPELFTYGLSFLVVGMYWMAHHRMFRSLVKVDRTLLWINLAVLGFVALLPLPTEILGKYGNTTLATVVYAGSIVAVGSFSVLLWWYMNHADLTSPMTTEFVWLNSLRGAIPPAVFALSIPIAFVGPRAGQGLLARDLARQRRAGAPLRQGGLRAVVVPRPLADVWGLAPQRIGAYPP